MQPSNITMKNAFKGHLSYVTDLSVRTFKKEAWERFEETGPARANDERWRFASLRDFAERGYRCARKPNGMITAKLLAGSMHVSDFDASAVFGGGHCIVTERSKEFAESGAFFGTIEEFARRAPRTFHAYFVERFARESAPFGSEHYYALHHAFATGCVLRLPAGCVLKKPVVIHNWATGAGGAIFPHLLVLAGENAAANIVEFQLETSRMRGSLRSLAVSSTDVFAGPGANVSRVVVQDWGPLTCSLQMDATYAARDAHVVTAAINLGSIFARSENKIHLNGAGAFVRPCGLTVATDRQSFDQRTLQVHNAGGATSNLLFKNALLDASRTVFSGLIQVAPNAQKTDAYQTNRNLLLSDNAEAISLPGLQIAANDVKCSHGATNSEVDAGELFYLRARGIPEGTARDLLISGFFEEVLKDIADPQIGDAVRALVHKKLEIRSAKVSGGRRVLRPRQSELPWKRPVRRKRSSSHGVTP